MHGVNSTPALPMSSQFAGPAMPPKTPTRLQPGAPQRLGWYAPQDLQGSTATPHPPGSSSEITCPIEKIPSLADRLTSAYMPRHSETSQLRDYFPDALANSHVTAQPPAAMHLQAPVDPLCRPYENSQPSDGLRYSRSSSVGPPSSAVAADYSGHPYSDASQPRSDGQRLHQPTPAYSSASSVMSQLHDSAYGSATNVQTISGPPAEVLPPMSAPAPSLPLRPPSTTSIPAIATPVVHNTHSNTSAGDSSNAVPSHILSALEDTRSIYELSRGELESLVARIVREDGFASLVGT